LKINNLHPWNLTPKEAILLQQKLRDRVILDPPFCKGGRGGILKIKTIAGADMALDDGGKVGFAGVIVYSFPELCEIERSDAMAVIKFPYIPGLLTFREGPALLKAFEKLKHTPDVIIFDGQGIAHPRGFGIASHMGLLLGRPTIGCAKSRLVGEYEKPGPNVGDWTPLIFRKNPLITQKEILKSTDYADYTEKELKSAKSAESVDLINPQIPQIKSLNSADIVIGAVLRTRKNVKPIYVSPGHLIDLPTSIEIVLSCLDRTRIPKPTREADHFVGMLKRDYSRSGATK
jgi:deoxyribonuclease V